MRDTFPSYRFLANISVLVALAAFILLVHTWEYKEQLLSENAMLRKAQQANKMPADPPATPVNVNQGDEPEGNAIAIQNRNPLNIKSFSKNDPWVGQVGTDKFGHAIFENWEYGIRAASLTLRSYARKHGIDTIEGVVRRFAEGNQDAYIRYLSRKLGVAPNKKIDLIAYMPQLLRHMARFETGQAMPDRWFAPYDVLAKL